MIGVPAGFHPLPSLHKRNSTRRGYRMGRARAWLGCSICHGDRPRRILARPASHTDGRMRDFAPAIPLYELDTVKSAPHTACLSSIIRAFTTIRTLFPPVISAAVTAKRRSLAVSLSLIHTALESSRPNGLINCKFQQSGEQRERVSRKTTTLLYSWRDHFPSALLILIPLRPGAGCEADRDLLPCVLRGHPIHREWLSLKAVQSTGPTSRA